MLAAARHWPEHSETYRFAGARIASAFLPADMKALGDKSGFALCDVIISAGKFAGLAPHQPGEPAEFPSIDAAGSLMLPGLVDAHVHLDKAYVAQTQAFPEGDLHASIAAMLQDKARWTEAGLRARAGFGLEQAAAQGVRALRTHLDWMPETPRFVQPVMAELAQAWRGRVQLQCVPLMPVDLIRDAAMRASAIDCAARLGGCLSFFVYDHAGYPALIRAAFDLAAANGFDLDFHVDEGLDAALNGLETIADAALETRFKGKVLCGHCVALSVYDDARRARVLDKAAEAGLAIVSLPLTNLYLQSRAPGRTPKQRGLAPLAEISARGIPVSIGCDNVRDGFYPYGDFDPLAALSVAMQAGHLPPAADWLASIATRPADVRRLGWSGIFAPGAPADFIVLQGRSMHEALARPGAARAIVRGGKLVEPKHPDPRALDGLA